MAATSSRRSFLTAPLSAPAKVNYRPLGTTGMKVTTVGFGCMITSDATVIERALDMGINYFDTARVYGRGNNERMVGTALKGRRKSVYLSSKTISPTRQAALDDLNTSLRELETDYLDIWYLHAKNQPQAITDDLMEAQRIAKKAGKIRFTGISNHSGHKQVLPAVIAAKHFDVLLTSYHFAMEPGTADLIRAVREAGIGVVAMKVMAGGYRSASYYPTADDLRAKLQREGAMLAALKWVIRDSHVDTTVPSMVDADQLVENFQAMSTPFSDADARALAAQLEFIRPLHCRTCGQCSGSCPQGLPVSDMLRYLSYADGYGQFPVGREKFAALPEAVRAVRCGDCRECTVQCPNGVRVAERLARAQELFA
ncbi:MAG TPA: aldo/keto reductase [Bryobacteraceae bacterium]|nr:aldo/keto reductase [Bryobacteraceae bacterium]